MAGQSTAPWCVLVETKHRSPSRIKAEVKAAVEAVAALTVVLVQEPHRKPPAQTNTPEPCG